jgi:hypothetical protein
MATVPGSGEVAVPDVPDVPDTSAPVPEDSALPSVPAVEGGEAMSSTATEVAPAAIDVRDLDWAAIREATHPAALRARMRVVVEQLEAVLDSEAGPGMLFDSDRADKDDRAVRVTLPADDKSAIWIIGDLHGDLLALEAALAQIHQYAQAGDSVTTHPPRIIFLGDFFDDEGFGLELLLRVFELIMAMPGRIAIVAGNHDEALTYDGARFASTVSPSDFADFLNANLAHEWIGRAGKLAVRMVARAPRALFFPDGLLIAHGGFPLKDLHPALEQSGNWNDPACLSDFIWVRAHPKARRKMPNRFSRGSQFGFEDFADFCALSARLGRPVTHMVRGHDHVEARYAIYLAYEAHPVLTTVALSRRLPREQFGPHHRAPTIARVLEGRLPQVYQLHIPFEMIDQFFPPPPGAPDVSEEGALS